MTRPIFPHQQNIENFAPQQARMVKAPVEGTAPPFGHMRAEPAAATARMVHDPATVPRRPPEPKVVHRVGNAGDYISGRAAVWEPPPELIAAEERRRRAVELLERQPGALEELKQRVIASFEGAFISKGRSVYDYGQPPSLRLACKMHELRFNLIEAPDDAARLLLLVDADEAIRTMKAYSAEQGRAMNEHDAAHSVALIAAMLRLPPCGHNLAITTRFFDPAPGPDVPVAPETGAAA